jgi:rod shape determining protein RodA
VGALVLLGLFMMLFIYGIVLSLSSFSPFGRLVGLGVVLNIFFSFFINTAMVMGLLPVVGVPLPFVSYGGSALVMMCVSCGFMMNVAVHKYEILG